MQQVFTHGQITRKIKKMGTIRQGANGGFSDELEYERILISSDSYAGEGTIAVAFTAGVLWS